MSPLSIASLAEKLGPALAALKNRIGKGDMPTLWVRSARMVYSGTAAVIIVAWYSGYRNQRVQQGDHTFPFPGLTKAPATGTVDRPDKQPINTSQLLDSLSTGGAAVRAAGVALGSPVAQALGAGIQGAADLTGRGGIVKLGQMAQHLGYHVGENPAFGGVTPGVHVAGSLHNSGRAIDVTSQKGQAPASQAATADLDAFANMLIARFGPSSFTEIIWNGPHPVAVKNGRVVNGPSVFGSEWSRHKNHVHVAI